jgi:hypothetical protein
MRRSGIVAVMLAAVMVLAACSSDSPTAADGNERTGADGKGRRSERTDGAEPGAGGKEDEKDKGRGSEKDENEDEELPGSDLPGSEDPPELRVRGEGGPSFARLSASAEEPEPDSEREGPLVPDYSEATRLAVKGLGDKIRFTWTFADDVPQQMPNGNTVMVLGLGISGEKRNDGYALGAQGSTEGWHAYAGYKNETRRFPGTFFVRGDTIEMTVRWKALGGPRPFDWFASANWFSQTGDVTSYSFDEIPNGKGTYPD